jgi:hypothetical protein
VNGMICNENQFVKDGIANDIKDIRKQYWMGG